LRLSLLGLPLGSGFGDRARVTHATNLEAVVPVSGMSAGRIARLALTFWFAVRARPDTYLAFALEHCHQSLLLSRPIDSFDLAILHCWAVVSLWRACGSSSGSVQCPVQEFGQKKDGATASVAHRNQPFAD